MNDHIGFAHMTQGNLTTFTLDRFGNGNSALALNGGWTQVPPGIYFDTPEFTISVWVYPQQVDPQARVIDFGDGPDPLNIILVLNDDNNKSLPTFAIEYTQLISSKSFKLYEWQHLAATFDGYSLNIHINGTLAASHTFSNYLSISIVNRTQNYVGKMNWDGDIYSYSYLDDLRFYNKSLTQQELVDLIMMNDASNRTCSMATTSAATTTGIILNNTKFSYYNLKNK
jgi:hypothetical protein